MLGENIKVHFAGNDGGDSSYIAMKIAGVNYLLYSCYSYILNKNVDDDFRLSESHILKKQCREMKHVIQDSGLFTLMFGAGRGKTQTKESLISWQDKLVSFVLQNNISATCVEIDCQKVLGVKEAWWFRERMRKILPNRQINVFHYEDGKKGLDNLIAFSDYIAFSIPELRLVKPKTYREDTKRLVDYTKSKKPDIDIHLLGCTEFSMLEDNRFCTSCDSTSWLSSVKYGTISDGRKKTHINGLNKNVLNYAKDEVKRYFASNGKAVTDKTIQFTANMAISAKICKKRYENVAGNQD